MWEKILIIGLCIFGLILYAFTVHLDRVLDDPLVTDHVNVDLDI